MNTTRTILNLFSYALPSTIPNFLPTQGPQLPVDLYRHIVRSLSVSSPYDRHALSVLARASRSFNEEVTLHLYHKINYPLPLKAHAAFVRTLCNSTRYAPLVRVYTFEMINHGSSPDRAFWSTLNSALLLMINLVEFRFLMWNLPPLAHTLLDGCGYPNLKIFQWDILGDEESLMPFFERHPQIRSLTLAWGGHPPDYALIPHLDFIGGDMTALNAFLPGRPRIQKVHLESSTFEDQPTAEFYCALGQVKWFTLQGNFRLADLPDIASYLSRVEVLQIHDLSPRDDLDAQLSKMQNLRRLIVSDVYGTEEEFSELRGRKLLRDHPTLNCIDFGKDIDDFYNRLSRGSAPAEQGTGSDAVDFVSRPKSVYLPLNWMADPDNVP
ncbi:hypothetical protein BDN72DRAFT_957118 [Pluteus cervinus]|uniref:Uncharacterized protein n=1 Tax=Pluteus cervinus TaxID=181527 RepID=A0ACD3B4N5_9AGAR|nr:hypothetical protein BDN72DRAFT_957118 [Pluteus cervinus]